MSEISNCYSVLIESWQEEVRDRVWAYCLKNKSFASFGLRLRTGGHRLVSCESRNYLAGSGATGTSFVDEAGFFELEPTSKGVILYAFCMNGCFGTRDVNAEEVARMLHLIKRQAEA